MFLRQWARLPRFQRASRGQGLVEFAIAVPVLLLILLIVIDAGRLFYGYVALQNASRIAASYAADHADAWPNGTLQQTEFVAMVQRDMQSLSCAPLPVPSPTFSPAGPPPRNPGPGHDAAVTLRCNFRPFAPLISFVIGNTVALTATTKYPIRSGILAGLPPSPTPTPTPSPTPTPTPTPSPTPNPTPGVTPTPTPTPVIPSGMCQVPNLFGKTVDQAKDLWKNAQGGPPPGFKPNNLDVTVGPPNYIVGHEDANGVNGDWTGTIQACLTFTLRIGP